MAALRRDPEHTGPLKKLSAVLSAASDPVLTSCDQAVFAWMVDLAREADSYVARPGFALLRHLVGRNRRTIAESVTNLVRHGYLTIVEAGRPGRRGHYGLTFKGVDQLPRHFDQAIRLATGEEASSDVEGQHDGLQAATHDGLQTITHDGQETNRVYAQGPSPVAAYSAPHDGLQAPLVMASRHPYTNQHPRQSAEGVVGGAVGTVAPGGAPPSGPGSNAFGRFKEAFVYVENVHAVAELLDKILRGGSVDIETLVSQAAAFRKLKQLQRRGDGVTTSALNWLSRSQWKDGYVEQLKSFEATALSFRGDRKADAGKAKSPAPGPATPERKQHGLDVVRHAPGAQQQQEAGREPAARPPKEDPAVRAANIAESQAYLAKVLESLRRGEDLLDSQDANYPAEERAKTRAMIERTFELIIGTGHSVRKSLPEWAKLVEVNTQAITDADVIEDALHGCKQNEGPYSTDKFILAVHEVIRDYCLAAEHRIGEDRDPGEPVTARARSLTDHGAASIRRCA